MKGEMKDFNEGLEDLQLRISKGDQRAFETVYLRYYRKLVVFSKNFLKSREHAEEVVEDVFVKLWSKREEIIYIQNLNVYLYSATKNKSLNALSSNAARFVTEALDIADHDSVAEGSTPHDLLVTSEVMQSVQRAMDLLPERCRIIFQLAREDGLKYKEIAQILNISVNTIDAQMAIAVKRLCASLGVEKHRKAPVVQAK